MGRHTVVNLLVVGVSILLIACVSGETTGTRPVVSVDAAEPERFALRFEELTYPQLDRIDRERSVFFITFGNMEEHGPHLPVGSDFFQANALRNGMLARLSESHPDYTFVEVPLIPLGEGGFNDVARQFDHIGTIGVRFSTLRDVAIDVASAIARHGFQNIFLIHFHGAPMHSVAFTQAAAFVSQKFGVRMVNVTSLAFGVGLWDPEVMTRHLGEGWEQELGLAIHAGPGETSTNLYLRDHLVDPGYTDLSAFPVMDFEELGRMHEREGFQGYANDPSLASRELGRELMNEIVERATGIARLALAGEDLSELPIYPDGLPMGPGIEELMALLMGRYAQAEAEIQAWLEEQMP